MPYVEDTGGRLGLRGPPQHTRLWDVANGKQLPELDGAHPLDRAFSPDGRLVATRAGNRVHVVATGKRVAAFPDDPMYSIRAATFSRDGRFLDTGIHVVAIVLAVLRQVDALRGIRDGHLLIVPLPGHPASRPLSSWSLRRNPVTCLTGPAIP